MMRRLTSVLILCVAAVLEAAAAFNLTATKAQIQDLTVDKNNFFVTVEAHTNSGEYEVAFDVWPATRSAIGAFSAAGKTISYINSFVHKTKANGSPVDMWYECSEEAEISLSIASDSNGTCTLQGKIDATRNGTTYTYIIAPFTFAYTEEPAVPQLGEDPFRFEPDDPVNISFSADVVHFRERTGYIEITLNEMANETYDWIELRLLASRMAMPAGTYAINNSGDSASLTASKGYLGGTQGDDPCYLAIRKDKENWGQYTPYYLESGSLTVSYNAKGDTIFIAGQALSHNGSAITIQARSYNMLYDPYEVTPEPEKVALAIDTVAITYRSDLSDSTLNNYIHTLNFFSSTGDYPNVLADITLPQPMALAEGTFTLESNTLSGLALFQNQNDFNSFFFGGEPYVFATAELTLSKAEGDQWRYQMVITDTIGSEYSFDFLQAPHIVLYPSPEDETDAKDKPYADEQKEKATINMTADSLAWNAATVEKDGIIDIVLTQREADVNGLRAFLHLGMYTAEAYPAAATYHVDDSEQDGSFSASLGRFGNTLIPCYLTLIDKDGWVNAVWYITSGEIQLAYDSQDRPILSGECTSYFGSTIRFAYKPATQGLDNLSPTRLSKEGVKVLHNGQLLIIRDGKVFNILGTLINSEALNP